jgi:diacylglycerol kinase
LPAKIPLLPVRKFYFSDSLTNLQASLNFREIVITTVFAIPVGLLLTFLINSRLLYKTANALKISDKIDDIGVWNHAFEAARNQWVIVRSNQDDLMYRGWVESFSDGLDSREILLRDVGVYRNSDADLLYSMPGLYIAFSKEDNLKIEFQSWDFSEFESVEAIKKTSEHEEDS